MHLNFLFKNKYSSNAFENLNTHNPNSGSFPFSNDTDNLWPQKGPELDMHECKKNTLGEIKRVRHGYDGPTGCPLA